MKLVALLVLLTIFGNNFVECTFGVGWDWLFGPGHGSWGFGSDWGAGSGTHVGGASSGYAGSSGSGTYAGGSSSDYNGGSVSTYTWGFGPPAEQTIVVAKDGTGNYLTIKDAIDALEGKTGKTIYIKKGVYNENIIIPKQMKDLRLKGDGKQATIITSKRGDSPTAGNYGLYNSATVVVEGDGFVATGITFRNTAGPQGNQAAAIRVEADQVSFYGCTFEGYQDTVYVHSGRHFFKSCDIHGNVDFICGAAAAVFQDCRIALRRPKTENGEITIATSSREDSSANQGLIFHRCRIEAEKEEEIADAKIYLGRPWKPYALTVFMQCSIDVPLQPEGWRHWQEGDRESESTVVYREYKNKGIGASTEGRVQWPGFKVITDDDEVLKFTVQNFLQGNTWLPRTGIPYIARL